ncbi:MAG: hypothetical protein V2A73_21325 [Pseudomonadota bacterium]
MKLRALSSTAASFPTLEVEYEDLLPLQYRTDGRGLDGTIDCIGIVLEVYRRAGIDLPDPRVAGASIWEFTELFDVVTEPLQLYDIISVRREGHHVETLVRIGTTLSARAKVGVYSQPLKRALRLEGVTAYRVRAEFLP